MPKQPQRKPASSKPGPKPMRPTKRQRHQVEMGVSIGMTMDQIAIAIALPRHTIYRHFRNELATGRAKCLLMNAVRLDKAADAGNVAAMKALHAMMERGQQSAAHDPWADLAASFSESSEAEDNLLQNPEFRDSH